MLVALFDRSKHVLHDAYRPSIVFVHQVQWTAFYQPSLYMLVQVSGIEDVVYLCMHFCSFANRLHTRVHTKIYGIGLFNDIFSLFFGLVMLTYDFCKHGGGGARTTADAWMHGRSTRLAEIRGD